MQVICMVCYVRYTTHGIGCIGYIAWMNLYVVTWCIHSVYYINWSLFINSDSEYAQQEYEYE